MEPTASFQLVVPPSVRNMNDLEDLKVNEVAFVDKGAGKGVKIALFKRFEKEETKKMKTLEEILAALSEDDAAIVLQALEAAAQKEEASEEEKAEEEKPEEEAAKAEEEDEEMEKRFCVLKSENEAMRQRIAKMEEDRERESFIKRAECFPNVPTFNTEELGNFLMQINKNLPAELAEKTEQMIKSVNEIVSDSALLSEFGKSGAGTTGNGSAMRVAESMADDMIAGDSSLTKATALNKVWEQNPKLRNQYRTERRGNK